MEYTKIAKLLERHLKVIINSSKDEKDLMFRIAGFYGTFIEVAKENKLAYFK